MSIQTEITRLNGIKNTLQSDKTAIANAITAKGGTLSQNSGFSTFATDIGSIDIHGDLKKLFGSSRVDITTDMLQGITALPNYAFYYNANIRNVVLPNTINQIGVSAFYSSGIVSLDLSLTTVNALPTNMAYGCSQLQTIVFPSQLTTISSYAFRSCTSLTGTIVIPSTVTTIGEYTFYYAGITGIVIPDTITEIPDSMFRSCSSLATITIPKYLTSLGGSAFRECMALTSLEFPDTLVSIGGRAFNWTTRLQSLTFHSTTPPTVQHVNVFESSNNCPIYVPAESVDMYKAATNWSTYASRIQAIPT